MDQHMTYDKERLLKQGYEEQPSEKAKKKTGFIWSYIIKPVRKDYKEE